MSGSAQEALLAVRGLTIRNELKEVTLLDRLDLDVAAGESVGIVGESGSGKSLAARSIMGLLPDGLSAAGEVTFSGRSILGERKQMARLRGAGMTMVLQDPFTSLSPLRRCGAQITDGPLLHKKSGRDRRGEAVRRLAEVGIDDGRVAEKFPFQLSGGMRQRVSLAAALASDPALLIADEFSTALDATTQKNILLLLDRIRTARDMALIMITHDLRMAFSICDRVYVLYAGSLVEVGGAGDVESEPLHPYTQGLFLAEPAADSPKRQLYEMPGRVPPADTVLACCPFADRCEFVEEECRAAKPPLRSIGKRWTACRRIEEIHADLCKVRLSGGVAEGSVPTKAANRSAGPGVLTVDGITKRFFDHRGGDLLAVSKVSLQLNRGETVGIVGGSGCGKTTLARCIVGLERPTEGSIEIQGNRVSDWSALDRSQRRRLRRTIQYVFQDPYSSLNPKLSIGSVLAEAVQLGPAEDVQKEVARLLELVHLPPDYAQRKPAALSGGERQRVAIARALAVQPEVVICDEVVSALDVSVQAQMLNLLREAQAELGVAYLFISHDLAVVSHVADRILVMSNGEVVEEGDAHAVLERPTHPYTKSLLESKPGTPLRPARRTPAIAS